MATVYGNSVTATVLPIYDPTAPPTPIKIKAYVITEEVKPIEAIVVTIPPPTPVIPITFPILALGWAANPQIAAMQHTEDAKKPI